MRTEPEKKFDVNFMEEAIEFIDQLDIKAQRKVLYNITKAQYVNDANLFKKLNQNIWEFRTIYNGMCYRLFAFWDEGEYGKRLVIATHGIIKKSSKTPLWELQKAEKLRQNYIQQK